MDSDSINNCIQIVGFEQKWTPNILNDLYIDNSDSQSLFFWYNGILEKVCNNNNNN